MQTLTHTIIDAGLRDRILTEANLRHHIEGSDQRRFHLVNRALKKKELVRISRGLYALSPEWRTEGAGQFSMAQTMVPGSYISAHSALSFHGWIPEGVFTTVSITPERVRMDRYSDDYGHFEFRPIPVKKNAFSRWLNATIWDSRHGLPSHCAPCWT